MEGDEWWSGCFFFRQLAFLPFASLLSVLRSSPPPDHPDPPDPPDHPGTRRKAANDPQAKRHRRQPARGSVETLDDPLIVISLVLEELCLPEDGHEGHAVADG